jgi:hypothetical protein
MKSKAKKPKKKPRRVVLGVGHPWFYGCLTQLTLRERAYFASDAKMLHIADLGAYNRIRLVAEVLK